MLIEKPYSVVSIVTDYPDTYRYYIWDLQREIIADNFCYCLIPEYNFHQDAPFLKEDADAINRRQMRLKMIESDVVILVGTTWDEVKNSQVFGRLKNLKSVLEKDVRFYNITDKTTYQVMKEDICNE